MSFNMEKYLGYVYTMTFSQSHNTPLVHWQQFCEKLSEYNIAVRSYGAALFGRALAKG